MEIMNWLDSWRAKELESLCDKIDELEKIYADKKPMFLSTEEMECWVKVGELIELWKKFKVHE
tara:strand:- start:10 stop:198 length:189 start_codon:yes stop_codon:yes gene_type:complete